MKKRSCLIAIFSAALFGCPPATPGETGGGGGGTSGGEISAQCSGDFGVQAAAQKLEAFMLATAKYTRAAADVQASLSESCRRIGQELGLSSAELSGDVRSVCNAASMKLREELSGLRASASLNVEVYARPPVCDVRVDAYAQCAAECQVDVQPGEIDLRCEGGEIVGRCEGSCQGSCAVDVQGRCQGSCEGVCEGGCTGSCQGACEGNCSARGADGQCNGRCDGTCHGTCSAGCRGSCEGECWVSAQASCQGECRGGCSVEYTEPRCTGHVVPPQIDAECRASCDARLDAEAHCEPGQVDVLVTGNVDSNLEPKLERVRSAMRAGYGGVLEVGARLARLRESGRELRSAAGGLGGTGRALGLNAVACMTEAGAAIANAVGSVSVSLEVQVSVTASVSGG